MKGLNLPQPTIFVFKNVLLTSTKRSPCSNKRLPSGECFRDTVQIEACKGSGNKPSDHFVGINKMVDIGSGAMREISDYQLFRYACCIIVQNGDPRKEVIAMGQTYFAVKTRQQELRAKLLPTTASCPHPLCPVHITGYISLSLWSPSEEYFSILTFSRVRICSF